MSPSGENERPRAIALRYARSEDAAPRVTASGRGELAKRMLALAREHGIPVREDADLVALLGACELGEEIPVELYAAVAKLLTYLHRLNGEVGAARADSARSLPLGPHGGPSGPDSLAAWVPTSPVRGSG